MAETLNLKQTASAYNYLSGHTTSSNNTGSSGNNKSDSCEDTVDGMDDQMEMENTLAAMKSVGMKNGQIKSILSLLGAILHLGRWGEGSTVLFVCGRCIMYILHLGRWGEGSTVLFIVRTVGVW